MNAAKEGSTPIDVLVADDEPDICEVLRDGLPIHGVSVRFAPNGKEAVLEALKKRPDAVLMDNLMPVLSGIDALGLFKIIEPLRSLPVLMLTALKGKDDVVAAMRAGAADYISKPFDLKDAAARIRRTLARPVSAPFPIFRHLIYTASADGLALRLGIDSDLTAECAEDLAALVRSLSPLQPICIELDLGNVPKIGERLLSPLVATRDAAGKGGGTMIVTRLDTKKHSASAVGILRKIFQIESEVAPPDPKRESRKTSLDLGRANKDLSDALYKISGFRYDYSRKNEISFLDFFGNLTADTCEKIDQAFNSVADSHVDTILRLDGLTATDSRGMGRLVEKITTLKNKEGLKVFVVAKAREIQTAFHKARGHLVTGLYEDKDKALSAFRSA